MWTATLLNGSSSFIRQSIIVIEVIQLQQPNINLFTSSAPIFWFRNFHLIIKLCSKLSSDFPSSDNCSSNKEWVFASRSSCWFDCPDDFETI